MNRARAIAVNGYEIARRRQIDLASSVIVLGCAAALIFAGQPLPL
jgi:hypothetical protein